MSVYVLDTSALLAYIENEDGVTEIENVLLETMDNQHTIYVSVVLKYFIFRSRSKAMWWQPNGCSYSRSY